MPRFFLGSAESHRELDGLLIDIETLSTSDKRVMKYLASYKSACDLIKGLEKISRIHHIVISD